MGKPIFRSGAKHRVMIDGCLADDILWSRTTDLTYPHEAWAKFAIVHYNNPLYRYNKLLYLTNCNVIPHADGSQIDVLPVWHAAVIAFWDNTPRRFMLIDEPSTLQTLRRLGDVQTLLDRDFVIDYEIETVECDLEEKPIPSPARPHITVAFSQGFPDLGKKLGAELARQQLAQLPWAPTLSIYYILDTPVMKFKLNFFASMTNPKTNAFHLIQLDELMTDLL